MKRNSRMRVCSALFAISVCACFVAALALLTSCTAPAGSQKDEPVNDGDRYNESVALGEMDGLILEMLMEKSLAQSPEAQALERETAEYIDIADPDGVLDGGLWEVRILLKPNDAPSRELDLLVVAPADRKSFIRFGLAFECGETLLPPSQRIVRTVTAFRIKLKKEVIVTESDHRRYYEKNHPDKPVPEFREIVLSPAR